MSEINPELTFTLDEAVEETLALLYGQGLAYDSQYDRYRVIAKMINRALRANALEHEWSFYHTTLTLEPVQGERTVEITDDATYRLRQVGDDAVRLVDGDDEPLAWAYFLPRDALHKMRWQPGYYCALLRNEVEFSKPLPVLDIQYWVKVPVMREPYRFVVPAHPIDDDDPLPLFDSLERAKAVDFSYPDVIVARAAYMYALTDPVVQPRAQTLEANYKDLMYQVIERDDRFTDSPLENNYIVPVQNSIYPESTFAPWPLADRRR